MDPIEKRIRLVLAGVVLILFVVLGKLIKLQIFEHEFWKGKARKQHVVQQPIHRKRGTIYDRNGNELAYTAAMKKMVCDPSRMKDVEGTLLLLSKFTRIQVEPLKEKLEEAREKKRRFFLIKSDVTLDEYEKIREKMREERQLLDPKEYGLLKGVVFFRDSHRRIYPYNMNASNLLGFIGEDGKGLEGVELKYDDLLRSRDGLKVYERGLNGIVIPGSEKILKEPQGGNSIYLSIDIVMQYLAEKKLREVFEETRPKSAMIVIQDPFNGEVLAMASQPSFNPNYFGFYSSEDFKNRVITDQFEPGSTMKVMVVAAALEENAINVEEPFECQGYIELYGVFRIHCDQRRVHGLLDPQHILRKSCNVGAIHVAQRLGKQRLFSYFQKFGFGEKTEVGLPGEVRGLSRPPSRWSGISIAALPIGQEIAVNALQMSSAFGSIVNGGLLYRPKILSRTRTTDGIMHDITEVPVRRVISKKTADTVMDMLQTVTTPGGSGFRAAVPGYSVAGKTGTAQSLAEMNRDNVDPLDEDSTPKVIASFIGAIPAEKPRLSIYVVVNEPRGEKYYGGQVAAPVFRELAREVMAYLRVPPTVAIGEDVEVVEQVRQATVVPYPELIQRESEEEGIPAWLNTDVGSYDLTPGIESDLESGTGLGPEDELTEEAGDWERAF